MAIRKGSKADKFNSLAIGEQLVFPISELGNIRSQASLYGAQFGKTFSTHFDREKATVTITRTK